MPTQHDIFCKQIILLIAESGFPWEMSIVSSWLSDASELVNMDPEKAVVPLEAVQAATSSGDATSPCDVAEKLVGRIKPVARGLRQALRWRCERQRPM